MTARAALVPAAGMVILAVKLVALFTVVELKTMPLPLPPPPSVGKGSTSPTVVIPAMKFVPVKTTSSVCKRLPLVGEMLVKVGTGLNVVALLSLEYAELAAAVSKARTR